MARKLFTITRQTRNLMLSGISTMIQELGRDCKFYFDSLHTRCPNCYFNTALQRSSDVYNGSGPRPFTRPPCPVCNGVGFIDQPHTEIARMSIDWRPKVGQLVAPGVAVPQGLVQTKGFMSDLPKVLQCKYMIIDYKNAVHQSNRFVRWGEPVDASNITPNQFFMCFWQRQS